MNARILLVLLGACGGSAAQQPPREDVHAEAAKEEPVEDTPVEEPAGEPEPEEAPKPPVAAKPEEEPAEVTPEPVVVPPLEKPVEEMDTDQVIEQQQVVVEDLKYDLAGLEWFLDDQHAHRTLCPEMTWAQPPIETYRQHPHSYLPGGCVGDAAEEEALEDIQGEEPREELPARR